jgi:hypothetical protein
MAFAFRCFRRLVFAQNVFIQLHVSAEENSWNQISGAALKMTGATKFTLILRRSLGLTFPNGRIVCGRFGGIQETLRGETLTNTK